VRWVTRPGGYLLPRHRVPSNSRDEGSKCVGRRGELYPPGPTTRARRTGRSRREAAAYWQGSIWLLIVYPYRECSSDFVSHREQNSYVAYVRHPDKRLMLWGGEASKPLRSVVEGVQRSGSTVSRCHV